MKIYTSKNCLNCINLKHILSKNEIKFEEIDGEEAERADRLKRSTSQSAKREGTRESEDCR